MKETKFKAVWITIFWLGMVLGTIINVILFIPMSIYGLINGLSIKECVETFWKGYYEELCSQWTKFRGLL